MKLRITVFSNQDVHRIFDVVPCPCRHFTEGKPN